MGLSEKMENNEEQARIAKEIAEKRFIDKSFAKAKELALKAQTLSPHLEGLSQFLDVLEVHISVEKKVNGEIDRYGVLGVEPSSDDGTIRRQYRKLVLKFHPDKNRTIGAARAFSIITEAYAVLSDQAKRDAYDKKINPRNLSQAEQVRKTLVPTGPSGSNNISSSFNVSAANAKPSQPRPTELRSFWTKCRYCHMFFEYYWIYRNHYVLCHTCKKPFLAIVVPPPPNVPSKAQTSYIQRQGTAQSVQAEVMRKTKAGDLLRRGNSPIAGATMAGRSATTGPAQVPKGNRLKEKNLEECNKSNFRRVHSEKGPRKSSGIDRSTKTRELSRQETRNLLIEMAKKMITEKLEELKRQAAARTSKKMGAEQKVNLVGRSELANARNDVHKDDEVLNDTSSDEQSLIAVPDSEFHDFDVHRRGTSFDSNQVWAAYDSDGMPRFYAMIHRVISREPFKLQISWLNCKSNHELGPLKWIDSGFYKTSGHFRLGKPEIDTSSNSFSHEVKWKKGKRDVIEIYPMKGEIWALYRNWSPDWNEHTASDIVRQYAMFEVFDDYNEKKGVTIAPLVKVEGHKTVFRRLTEASVSWTVPKEELFRFSHFVPSYLLIGHEGSDAPKGCWELDPAATPIELVPELSEVLIKEMMKTAESQNTKHPIEDVEDSEEKQAVENENKDDGEGRVKGKKRKETNEGETIECKRRQQA